MVYGFGFRTNYDLGYRLQGFEWLFIDGFRAAATLKTPSVCKGVRGYIGA